MEKIKKKNHFNFNSKVDNSFKNPIGLKISLNPNFSIFESL